MSDNTPTCCGGAGLELNEADDRRATNLLDAPDAERTTCPVMLGTTVIKKVAEAAGLFRDHNGRRYWLCCHGCGPRFDRNPDKYAIWP
ncbi:hypothetical protein NIIDNTM18_04230 [Mycolicibacterium litorale]|uniref:YHS domain-containing protein n=1 Tax=Mycolicibacterium litorale TaxID=758802 RepID=A0A6S6NYN4_9MYCO|nr:hypothetical protein [Mycolicibacterium litorale]BCI51145.1 hypothetical protein NIIDNTM18_04230 [Mycolicibacterium litorale]